MGSCLAVSHFRPRGIDLKAEAFGRSWEFERDGRRVSLSLRAEPSSFGSYIDAMSIARHQGDGETAWDEGRVLVAAVLAVQIAVDVDFEPSTTDLASEEHAEEIEAGQAALDEAFPTALSLASDFISWLRVGTGRYWLGPSHEAPEVIDGNLIEKASGSRVRNISFNPVIHISGFGTDSGLTVEELDRVAKQLTLEETPQTAEVLLSDARETLTGRTVEQDWQTVQRDIRRAILLAAIASEVKIKSTLLDKTPPDRRGLVEIILKNIREVQVAVGALPHQTMKAAVGHSLHEDDTSLFDAVNKLFRDRNNIAHRGEPPTLEDARADVRAAADLFTWLDSLPTPPKETLPAV
jgi:hypothetical protein